MKVSFDIPDDVYHAVLIKNQSHPITVNATVDEAIEFELCSLLIEENEHGHPLLPWAAKRYEELIKTPG